MNPLGLPAGAEVATAVIGAGILEDLSVGALEEVLAQIAEVRRTVALGDLVVLMVPPGQGNTVARTIHGHATASDG
jgi:hypothetical protein